MCSSQMQYNSFDECDIFCSKHLLVSATFNPPPFILSSVIYFIKDMFHVFLCNVSIHHLLIIYSLVVFYQCQSVIDVFQEHRLNLIRCAFLLLIFIIHTHFYSSLLLFKNGFTNIFLHYNIIKCYLYFRFIQISYYTVLPTFNKDGRLNECYLRPPV